MQCGPESGQFTLTFMFKECENVHEHLGLEGDSHWVVIWGFAPFMTPPPPFTTIFSSIDGML